MRSQLPSQCSLFIIIIKNNVKNMDKNSAQFKYVVNCAAKRYHRSREVMQII